MSDGNAGRAKLLFVVSNDYGELADAMYLIRGTGFETVLLLPDRLFAMNAASLPVRNRCFRSVRDVTEAAAAEDPDLVFLFSGYLYAVNNIFSLDAVEELIGGLRGAGRRIITSDPFLGILSRLDGSTFSDRHPLQRQLTAHFSRLARLLSDLPHLYLVAPGEGSGLRTVSFFNPNILLSEEAVAECGRRLAGLPGLDPGKKRWLFILSLEDYGYQAGVHGRGAFDDLLVRKLQETAREGRQPVLVAPEACTAALRAAGRPPEEAILLPFCPYDLFLSLLFDAEYVFYWNIFSNSVPARAVNRLPLFFFDRGHMVHAIPPLFAEGMKRYFPGSELSYLDQIRELRAKDLVFPAAAQEESLQAARENLQSSPPPQEMVARLLRG